MIKDATTPTAHLADEMKALDVAVGGDETKCEWKFIKGARAAAHILVGVTLDLQDPHILRDFWCFLDVSET